MTVTEVVPNAQYTVTVTAPIDFLTDPDTQYPVSIDPAVVLYEEDLGETTYRFIQNIGMYDTEETGDYLNEYMFPLGAGEYDVSGDKTRMLYSFTDDFYASTLTNNIPFDIGMYQLSSATLYVYTETGYEAKTVAASAYWEDWPATVTEGLYYCDDSEIFDGYDDMYEDITVVPAGTADIIGYDITSVVSEWFYNYPNSTPWITGIMLRLYNYESNDFDGSYIDLELTGYGCLTSVSFDYSEYKVSNNYITASTGEFLYYSGTAPASNIYSNAVAKKWGLVYAGDYEYYIYLAGVGYLTASEDGSVYFASRDYDDEDGTQKWEIYGGGIRNIYTGTYLCKGSTGIGLSSSGPYSNGNARWTIYQSSEYVPLTDFELEDDWIPVNFAKTLAIATTPSNSTHSVNSSFTWSESSSAFSLSSTSVGQVLSGSTVGVAYLTVTHNATGITKSLRIYRGAIREGTYMFRNRGTGRYMAPNVDSSYDTLVQEDYSIIETDRYKWIISLSSAGYYIIESVANGTYVTIEENDELDDLIVVQRTSSSQCQYWNITSTSAGFYKLSPQIESSSVLTFPSNVNGIPLCLNSYTNDNDYNDEWCIDISDGVDGVLRSAVYSIENQNSGKNIAIDSSALGSGSNVYQATEVESEKSMLWKINHIGNGEYKIINLANDKLISVSASSSTEQANIQVCSEDGTTGQIFKIQEHSDGTFSFLSKCSGYTKALTVAGSSTLSGANIVQSSYVATSNQKFILSAEYVMLYICASEANNSNELAGSIFGHAWIEITNLTTESISVGHYSIAPGEHISIGLFGSSITIGDEEIKKNGIWYNRESYACYYEGKYSNYTRRGVLLKNDKLDYINEHTIEQYKTYNAVMYNCCHYALNAWNMSVSNSDKLEIEIITNPALSYMIDEIAMVPKELVDSMQESSNYEIVVTTHYSELFGYYNGTELIMYHNE